MAYGDVAGNGQAEPGAAVAAVAGLIDAGEPFEDPLPVRRGNAGAVVADLDPDRRRPAIAREVGAARRLLETLLSTERAVFVFREVFDVPYEEIAPQSVSAGVGILTEPARCAEGCCHEKNPAGRSAKNPLILSAGP